MNHEPENCAVDEMQETNENKPDENEEIGKYELNQNNEFEQQLEHEDNATQNENDTSQMVQRSARQRKPNIRYSEYLYTKTDDKISDQKPMDEDELEDVIRARVLEYFLA